MKTKKIVLSIITLVFLCFNLQVSAQYKFKIVVDANQIWRSELPDAGRLKCDGLWSIPGNSAGNRGWDIPLSEWWAGYSQMVNDLTITEDYYLNFPEKNYDLTEAILNQDPTGNSRVNRICLYAEPSKPVDPHPTTVVSDHVIQTNFDQTGCKVIVLSRSYNGNWKTEVQRALQNPLVDGVCLEQKPKVSTYQSVNFDDAIRDILKAGKRVYLLLPPRFASDNTIYSDDLEAIFNYVKNNVPGALHNENLYFIPNCYSRIKDKTTTMYGGDDSVEGAIKRLKELRDSYRNVISELPGKMEAETFSSQSGIDTESTTDIGGGENIGWIENGDWAEYSVNVTQGGSFNVNCRVASGSNGGTLTIKSGNTTLGSVTVPGTTGWQTWTTVSTSVNLSAGEQTITAEFSGGAGFLFNVNWLEFNYSTSVPIGEVISLMGNNGKYICSENGIKAMICNRSTSGAWERFTLVDAGAGKIALKGNNGKYVNNGSPMWCNVVSITNAAKFTWTEIEGDQVALKGSNNKFVSSENGLAAMNCNRTAIGGWEKFTWNIIKSASDHIDNSLTNVSIFPNPAKDVFTISGLNEGASIEVYGINGRLIYSDSAMEEQLQINSSEFTKGIYFIRINEMNNVITKKLIIK